MDRNGFIISKITYWFQFHPEKSGKSGLKILNNWLTLIEV